MVITVLNQTYKCGCNKGMNYYEAPNILSKLNMIIEWDSCTFPIKLKEGGNPEDEKDYEEDKKFLGDVPELKPGNVFLLDGQVIAIDSENKIVLVISETGWNSLKRIVSEILDVELELEFNEFETKGLIWENCDKSKIPENYEFFTIPYEFMKVWKEKFYNGRDNGMNTVKIELSSNNCIFDPTVFYIIGWEIAYDPELICEELMETVSKEIISWFYRKYPRIIIAEDKSKKE